MTPAAHDSSRVPLIPCSPAPLPEPDKALRAQFILGIIVALIGGFILLGGAVLLGLGIGNYVPSEVRLTASIAFPAFERGVQTGLNAPPVGTKVKLLKVTGYNVLVEYRGQQKSISATSTDLLQRMLGTSDD